MHACSSRSCDKKKIVKLYCADIDVELSEEQYTEMCDIIPKIVKCGNEELTKLFSESDEHGVGDVMRDIWLTDIKKTKG